MFKRLSLPLALAMLPIAAGSACAMPSSNPVADLNGSLAGGMNPGLIPAASDVAVLGATGEGYANERTVGRPADRVAGESSWIVDAGGMHDPKRMPAQLSHVYSGLPELETWIVLIVGLIGIGARSRHRSLPPGTEY